MTAGVYRQCQVMRDYLIPALPMFNRIQRGWELLDDQLIAPPDKTGWTQRFLWYSADNPGFFEGQHAQNLALLLDECKSIKNEMAKNALIRLAPKRVLAMSSTGDAIGWFADMFGKDAGQWDAKVITAFECRKEVREWAEAEVKRRGGMERAIQDPEFCSAVLSQFTSGAPNALFSLQALQHCLKMAPHIRHHHDNVVVAGLDASKASGEGDECVLRFRLGNKLYRKKSYVGFTSPVDLAGTILEDLLAQKAQWLNYDAADLGVGGILARMIDSQKGRIKLNPVHFGNPANLSEVYASRRVEMYYAFKQAVDKCDVIFPDDSEDLIAQLATIQKKPTETGIKKLVTKADMRKEGIRSPDDADATVLCWQKPVAEKPSPLETDLKHWIDQDGDGNSKLTDPGWHPGGFYLGRS